MSIVNILSFPELIIIMNRLYTATTTDIAIATLCDRGEIAHALRNLNLTGYVEKEKIEGSLANRFTITSKGIKLARVLADHGY